MSIIGEIDPDDPPNSEQFIKIVSMFHIYESFIESLIAYHTLFIVVTPHKNLHKKC